MTAGAAVTGVGVVTGWGAGVDALPDDARSAARGRRVVGIATPATPGERFRRATRECLLGITAVDAALVDAGLGRADVRGLRTALVYATAGGYGASNRAFIESATSGALHFPYTAPSAVPAEVTIELGLTGPYVILIGGAAATGDALWQAGRLVDRGQADRALVLAVETFRECEALWTRARWLVRWPLTEAAACAVIEAREHAVPGVSPTAAQAAAVRRRVGETASVGPLIALALARAEGERRVAGTRDVAPRGGVA
jgi:3-oxoacyl-[acyl-carrier-protein] synthase III